MDSPAKAGQAIRPIKTKLFTDENLHILNSEYPQAHQILINPPLIGIAVLLKSKIPAAHQNGNGTPRQCRNQMPWPLPGKLMKIEIRNSMPGGGLKSAKPFSDLRCEGQ